MAPRRARAATSIKDAFKAQKPGVARGVKSEKIVTESASEDSDDASTARDARELKMFDLTSRFGPCQGLTRIERWDRANALGLAPPKIVLEILHRRPKEAKWTECVWHRHALMSS